MPALLENIRAWAIHATADDFWPVAIGFAVITLVCFIAGFTFLYRKRIIQDTPTSRIRSAAQGYVELVGEGRVPEGESITAPLTGTTCLWYEYKIEKRVYRRKRFEWDTIEDGISDSMFLLQDETDEVLIDPDGAKVTARHSNTWYGTSRYPEKGTPTIRKFKLVIGTYRYSEKRLHPGEPLYAIGLFNTTGGSNVNLDINQDVRILISEWKKNSEKLLEQFDTNHDGEFDLKEWGKVREAALKEVMATHNEIRSFPPVNILGKTCDRRRPFLLSAYPQSETIKKYTLYTGLCFSAFFFAGLVSTWLISIRLAG